MCIQLTFCMLPGCASKVQLTPIPTLKESEAAAARSKFRKICDAFGLQPLGDAGWHVVTNADGG